MSKEEADAFSGACDICGTPLFLTFGKPEARSLETRDEYKNKKLVSGVEDMIEKRAHEHFVKHDLPKIINEQGMDYAKRNGFVDEDGRPK